MGQEFLEFPSSKSRGVHTLHPPRPLEEDAELGFAAQQPQPPTGDAAYGPSADKLLQCLSALPASTCANLQTDWVREGSRVLAPGSGGPSLRGLSWS